jgi:hypothetical protein
MKLWNRDRVTKIMHIAALNSQIDFIMLNQIVEEIFESVQLTTTAAAHVVDSGHLLSMYPFRRVFDIQE